MIIKYTRGLLQNNNYINSPISSLNGYSPGMMFDMKGVNTIGDLFDIYKDLDYDDKTLDWYLRYKLNIYSNFYVNNIIKQLGFIKYINNNKVEIKI